MKNINHYAILADLFEYPGPDFPDKVMKAQEVLNEKYPDAANLLQPFTEFFRGCRFTCDLQASH